MLESFFFWFGSIGDSGSESHKARQSVKDGEMYCATLLFKPGYI